MRHTSGIVSTIAALSLAATSATAAFATAPAKGGSAHQATATQAKSHQSRDVVYTAPFPSTPVVTPDYIYVPAATPTPATAAQIAAYEDDCAVTGNDCTPEQLCETWGEC
jgi:hypothetical protein